MVTIKSRGHNYAYPDKAFDLVLLDKTLKSDFARLCKVKKISKSKLLEEFYKLILLKFRSGTLTSGYITIDIFNSLKSANRNRSKGILRSSISQSKTNDTIIVSS